MARNQRFGLGFRVQVLKTIQDIVHRHRRYFAYRFLVYVIWDTGEGAWTLFRLHPGFLSFLVLCLGSRFVGGQRGSEFPGLRRGGVELGVGGFGASRFGRWCLFLLGA